MAHLRTLAVATFSLLCAACSDTPASCGAKVAAAFERLRTSDRPYRKETIFVVNDHQTFHEIVEFVPPDRMRQITNNGVPGYGRVETIRIGERAWSNEGERWSQWEPGLAENIYGVDTRSWPPAPAVPTDTAFECLGRVEFKGTTYIGYRQPLVKGVVRIVTDSGGRLNEKEEQEVLSRLYQMPQASRTVFVDWPSMLPAYDIWAPENQLDNPKSSDHYTYPGAISIEAPAHYGFKR